MRKPRRLFRERRQAPADDLSRYCVLVPFLDHIKHPTERQLRLLEDMGVPVHRMPGCSEISFCRSQLASLALQEGKEAILFIDSDIVFRPEDAVALLRRPEMIVAGAYAQKSAARLNVGWPPDLTEVGLGTSGRDYEVLTVGAGFLRIRAEALMQIADHHKLPTCTGTGSGVIPFFLPLVDHWNNSDEWSYFGEDAAFCHRARQAGLKILVDTRIRLHHLGDYPYGAEEACGHKVQRVAGITMPIIRG
jgi:hypothetical protein